MHPPRVGSRVRRWLLAVGVVLLGLLGLGALAVWVLLSSLDRPWLKSRLVALVQAETGLELDYGSAQLSLLSGLAIDDLVVRTPAELRRFAPELARVGKLRARWSSSTLLATPPSIRDVQLEHVAVSVVMDEHGRTSFDAIPEVAPKAPEPATPLSRQADAVLGSPLPLKQLRLADVSATLVRIERAAVVERDVLRGFAATLELARAGDGSKAFVTAGTPKAPLVLTLERDSVPDGKGSAVLLANIALSATRADATLNTQWTVRSQNLAPAVPVDALVSLMAHVGFDAPGARTRVELTRLEAADGSLHAEAQLKLPDRGAPVVHHALVDVDAARLLRLAAPFHVPVSLERGALHARVHEIELDRFTEHTEAQVQGELHGLELRLASGTTRLDAARIALEGQPRASTLTLSGELSLHGATFDALSLDDARIQIAGSRTESGSIDAHVVVHAATLAAAPARVHDASLELHASGLTLDGNAPLASHGDLSVQGTLGKVELAAATRIEAVPVKLRAHLPLRGGAPFTLAAELSVARLRARGSKGQALVDMPVDLELGVKDVVPDLEQPLRTRGSAHVAFDAGPVHAVLDAQKQLDALDYELQSGAAQLGPLRPFLPPTLVPHVPWDSLGFALKASGHAERLSSREPLVREQTRLELMGPAYDDIGARTLVLALRSDGTRIRHEAHADLHVGALHVGAEKLGDEQVALSATLDRTHPSLRIQLDSARLPKTATRLEVAFDRQEHALRYHLHSKASQFAALAPLLAAFDPVAGFDLAAFAVDLDADGTLTGVIDDVDPRGELRVAAAPLASAGGHGKLAVDLEQLRWSYTDTAISLPSARWRATLHGAGHKRSIDSDFQAEHVEVGLGRHRIRASGVHDQTAITVTGDPVLGTIDHQQTASIREVEQRIVPMYRLGDLRAKVVARRTGDGLIKLNTVEFENGAGGSSLSLQGGFDLNVDRQRMSFHGHVVQDLAKLSNRNDQFVGHGRAAMELTVASPDFRLFYTRTKLELHDVSLALPAQKIKVDSMDGEVPILADFAVSHDGVEVLRGAEINPYATQRFSDQHPLLNHRSFLSIGSISTPYVAIKPFAANLKIERNIVSLSQVELGVRHGTITGNGIFDYNGADSRLETNVRASNVLSSHGEPFDGNAALVMELRDRSIEGRADILRIGRRHLLDLIDLQDPRRVDPAMNQIRTALRFGYPDRVRLAFKHGFASAGVELGGLARLIKIGDVRGIPIGPLMERVVRSIEPPAEEP